MGERPAAVTTCAFIVTRGSTPFLPHAVASLRAQTLRPHRAAIVDVSAPDSPEHLTPEVIARMTDGVYLIEAAQPTLGAAVTAAVKALGPDDDYLWILHDDCAPAPDCLEHLTEVMGSDEQIAITGPKQCRWDDDSHLLEVGIHATAHGRRLEVCDPGEVDQGQHDRTGDVLAVGSAGMLVDRRVWKALGGFDRNLGPFYDGWEFGRRARLAGYRVVVATDARVRHARASFEGARVARRSPDPADVSPARLIHLARASAAPPEPIEYTDDEPHDHVDMRRPAIWIRSGDPTLSVLAKGDRGRSLAQRRWSELYAWALSVRAPWLPFVLLTMIVAGLGRAIGRLLTKQPAAALAEFCAPWRIVGRLDHLMSSRRQVARQAQRPRSVLKPFQASLVDVWEDQRIARKIRSDALAPAPLEPIAQANQRLYRRRALWTFVALIAAVTAVTVWAFSARWAGFMGGEFATLPLRGGDLWDMAWSAWVNGGDGSPGPARPLLVLLALGYAPFALVGVTPTAWFEVAFLLTPIVSFATAWIGCGALARSLPMRAFVATAWALWPTLWIGLWAGDVGTVAAHVGLPLLVWGVRAMSGLAVPEIYLGADGDVQVPRTRAATCGAGVAALVLPWMSATHLVVGTLFAVVMVGLGVARAIVARTPRYALRAGAAVIPSIFLMLPSIVAATHGAGLRTFAWASPTGQRVFDGPDRLSLALGSPINIAVISDVIGTHGTWWLIAVACLPAVTAVGGALALARPSRVLATRAAWLGVVIVWLVLLTAPHQAAPGPMLSLGGWCLLAAAAGWAGLTWDRSHVWTVAPAALVGAALVASAVALPGLATKNLGAEFPEASVRHTRVPPAAELRQRATAKSRLLVVHATDDGIAVDIWRGMGRSLTDVSDAQAAPGEAASQDLANALARGTRAGSTSIAQTLANHAIDEVVLRSQGPADDDLAMALDAASGLTRVSHQGSEIAWRVDREVLTPGQQPRRAWIADSRGATPLDSGASRISTTLAASSSEREITLAERAARGWHASLDGESLAATTTSGWAQGFTVPAGLSGHLSISYGPAWWPWWRAMTLVSFVLAAIAAFPTRRRRVL